MINPCRPSSKRIILCNVKYMQHLQTFVRISRLFTLYWPLVIPQNNYLKHGDQDQPLFLLRRSLNSTDIQ